MLFGCFLFFAQQTFGVFFSKADHTETGWLLDQAATFASFKKPGAPGRVRASTTSRMGSVCTRKASGRAVRTSARPAEPKGTRAGGWRRTPTTGEVGTHPRREWPAPAPRASPRPFRRRLRLKGDGSNRSWRRQTPDTRLAVRRAVRRAENAQPRRNMRAHRECRCGSREERAARRRSWRVGPHRGSPSLQSRAASTCQPIARQ